MRPRSLLALLFGCVLAGLAPPLADAATLRIGLVSDPDTLDPAASGSFVALQITGAMCDRLIDTDPALNYIPMLATGWTWSDDLRALTLTLRPGLRFADGEPFDAAAVKWNIDRYKTAKRSKRITQLKPIAAVVVVDPLTVRFELATPYAPLLMQLADRPGMMLAPHATDAGDAIDGADGPVCIGPYQFVRRVAQDRITLKRNPSYWDPHGALLDEVQFVTVPDASVRLIGLRTGQLDLIERVAPTDLDTLRADPHLTLVSKPGLGFQTLQFNLAHGPQSESPLRDARVREAFEAALDRDVINQVVFSGQYVPDNQPEPIGGTYYDPDFPVPHADLARARALLAASGQPHPQLTLVMANDPVSAQLGEVIQSMVGEAGFELKVQLGEPVSLFAAIDRGEFQINSSIWSGRTDPDQNIAIWVQSDGFLNRGQYANPALDAILRQATETIDVERRRALYRQAASIYLTDRPYIFLYHYVWLWGASDRLRGFVPHPDGVIRLRGVSLGP